MRIHPELPLYELAGPGGTVLLYTPGTLALVTQAQADALRRAWRRGADAQPDTQPDASIQEQSAWLLQCAREAVHARNRWLTEAYRPECLTVYLSNHCTLRCVYCFAAAARKSAASSTTNFTELLQPDAFASAAAMVAANCADKGRAFQFACHGGGEPSLHWDLALRLAAMSKAAAERHGISWNGYIATNGIIASEQAREMAAVFGRVGLSCDGLPDIQDRQRPSRDGSPTSGQVWRTALALKEAGARLELRATITAATVSRQTEILEYLVAELGADSVTFEPVYCSGSHDGIQPETWAEHFMQAKREAERRNVTLAFSGFRPDEQHGPYCNTLRQVLHLIPDGSATNCFLVTDGNDPRNRDRIIGGFDRGSEIFHLDQEKIASLRERAARIPSSCRSCFAAYHCARCCPDACVPDTDMPGSEEKSMTTAPFRCRLNRAVGQALLYESAMELLREEAGSAVRIVPQPCPDGTIAATLTDFPRSVREDVLHTLEASQSHYHLEDRKLPAPLWQKKGFTNDSEVTWAALRRIVNESEARPFSMYVHIPFCEKRCGFCDCYTVNAKAGHPVQTAYARRLCRDLEQWSAQGSLNTWPVTTVHFGGGTPNALQPAVFESIVESIRNGFATHEATEWALESTTRQLTGQHLDFLWNLGFRRLHIGVQTLEEPLRQEVGRQESSQTVLERITACLERGFVTTVDLLYGLPGETVTGFFSGLERLDRLGIHGMSLYHFNRSHRNRGFLRHARHQSDSVREYALFTAADDMLTRAGYDKNHFCHYARPQDRNLYYNHARRGEDLLALGASADGVFGKLQYRSPHLSKSFLDVARTYPLFEGSIYEQEENSPHRIVARHLMTGSVHKHFLCGDNLDCIAERWRDCRLVREKRNDSEILELTATGSWHLCAMLEELEGTG